MEVRLLITHGKANVKEVLLGPETVIGRSVDCNLKIASGQVSRRHCRITVTDSKVRVCDLGSANGTFVNGKQLPKDKDIAVAPGAALVIGPLKFVVQFKPPVLPAVAVAKPLPPVAPAKKTVTKEEAAEIQSLAEATINDEETVDYPPSQQRRDAAAATPQAAPAPALAKEQVAAVPIAEPVLPKEILPEGTAADTVYDTNLAAEVRELAARMKAAEVPAAPQLDEPQFDDPRLDEEKEPSKDDTHIGTSVLADSVVQELAAEANAAEADADLPVLAPVSEALFGQQADATAESDDEDEDDEEAEEEVEPAPKRGFFGFLKFGKKKPAAAVEEEAADEESSAEESPPEGSRTAARTDHAVATAPAAEVPADDPFATIASVGSAAKADDFDLDWLAPPSDPATPAPAPKTAGIAAASKSPPVGKSAAKHSDDDEPESELKNFLSTFKDE